MHLLFALTVQKWLKKQIAKYGPSRFCKCGTRATYKIRPQANFCGPNCQRVSKALTPGIVKYLVVRNYRDLFGDYFTHTK